MGIDIVVAVGDHPVPVVIGGVILCLVPGGGGLAFAVAVVFEGGRKEVGLHGLV
jgi:hypothetical protein